MAVYHNMLAIDIIVLAIKYLHMKKPKEAADPIMYWLNILIGPLVPLPKLQVNDRTRIKVSACGKLQYTNCCIVRSYRIKLMVPKTKPTQRPTVPPIMAPIFIFSTLEGSILSIYCTIEATKEKSTHRWF